MKPPPGVEVIESSTSISWIEGDILCSVSKKAPPQTLEEMKRDTEEFRKRFGDRKFCMLVDITNSSPTTKEGRDYAAEEIPRLVKAIAMISHSAFGRMAANLFFGLKPPPYPTKIFDDEKQAREWLKQYI
jgi:hypothetical protein